MIPPVILPTVRRAILDLLEDIGGEHNDDTLTQLLRSLGHRVARRDIAEQLRWLAVVGLTLERALEEGLYQRICLRTGQTWTPEAQTEWEAKLRRTYGAAADEELDVIPSKARAAFAARIDALVDQEGDGA